MVGEENEQVEDELEDDDDDDDEWKKRRGKGSRREVREEGPGLGWRGEVEGRRKGERAREKRGTQLGKRKTRSEGGGE